MKMNKQGAEGKITGSTPYLSKGIYRNYTKGMEKKNLERKGEGLKALRIRSFEEWVGQ